MHIKKLFDKCVCIKMLQKTYNNEKVKLKLRDKLKLQES